MYLCLSVWLASRKIKKKIVTRTSDNGVIFENNKILIINKII